jgi:hypothetical protein
LASATAASVVAVGFVDVVDLDAHRDALGFDDANGAGSPFGEEDRQRAVGDQIVVVVDLAHHGFDLRPPLAELLSPAWSRSLICPCPP